MKLDPIKICICGSVDDGKSTLVGRILLETKNIFADQIVKLKNLSKRYGTTGSNIDYALSMDGLQEEREQGITIDVAHKYINYNKRRIVFCDSPGHKEYTKNVVTAASQCDAAIVLVDASKGVLEQTRRHIAILYFVGIKHFIFAINKMDYVSYNYNVFMKIQNQISLLLKDKNFISTSFVPISALKGDNVASLSSKLKWYKGKALLKILSIIKVSDYIIKDAYIAIQHVHRPNPLIRHYMGIKNGQFFKNDKIIVFPSRQKTTIKNTFQGFEKNNKKLKSNIISFETKDEISITRGDIVVKNKQGSIQTGNAFNASVCIISDDNLYSGRDYIMRIGNKEINININKIKNKLNLSNNKRKPCNELFLNDLGEIEFNSIETVAFIPFDQDKFLGAFILIDKEKNNTVAVGKINFALRRSESVFAEKIDVSKKKKKQLLKQDSVCVWFTGLSGSGKSTIAKALEKKLYQQEKITVLLDADNLRLGINRNLGYSKSDRIENVRRISEIAKLLVESGLIVIVACISPYEQERRAVRSLLKKAKFFEVFVNTPLSVCKNRDPKGLYKKSKMNKTIDKTGLSNLYEKPKHPDLEIDTSRENINSIVNKIVNKIL